MKKIRKTWPDLAVSWTTLAIQSAAEIPRHRDSHNEYGTYNYVLELKTENVEGLWVQAHGPERPWLVAKVAKTISTRTKRPGS